MERERARLLDRTKRSGEFYDRAKDVMPGGVPSQFQKNDPWPTYLTRGKGSQVWDVDGNQYTDFHNGFGVMCVGHANPTIATAVKARMDEGTHFAAPTEGSIVVAEELRRRWGLPHWRFTNSGTESTMDAIHLARGHSGRDVIVKIEGTYHGHHDAVMVSVKPPADQMGDRSRPNSLPYGLGYAPGTAEYTRVVPFNDADALERLLSELDGQVAGVIMEPAMMNINIVAPVVGYLDRVREITRAHGVMLIFDEVKTGAAVAAGGATELFGVKPDVVCLAKAICGGLPGGAIGMTDELAALIESNAVRQQGTFNGNPLVMAAAQATLIDVLTPAAYKQLHAANEKLMTGCDRVIAEYGLPAHTVGLGSKGCVVMSSEPVREYRDYLTNIHHDLTNLAWLYHMNHGIFMTPGEDEEWTLSVLHTDADLQRYVDVFETFARDVTGR
jgi:glutamate-1-semialdehyde 2,1-aminomutase